MCTKIKTSDGLPENQDEDMGIHSAYGVVPKGLLTFLCSLYKEVAKTTSGTLVYRQKKIYFLLRKTLSST